MLSAANKMAADKKQTAKLSFCGFSQEPDTEEWKYFCALVSFSIYSFPDYQIAEFSIDAVE